MKRIARITVFFIFGLLSSEKVIGCFLAVLLSKI